MKGEHRMITYIRNIAEDDIVIGSVGEVMELHITRELARDIITSIITPPSLPRTGSLGELGKKLETKIPVLLSGNDAPVLTNVTFMPFTHYITGTDDNEEDGNIYIEIGVDLPNPKHKLTYLYLSVEDAYLLKDALNV